MNIRVTSERADANETIKKIFTHKFMTAWERILCEKVNLNSRSCRMRFTFTGSIIFTKLDRFQLLVNVTFLFLLFGTSVHS